MTTAQRLFAVQEAANYSDPDAFVSDLLLSAAFLPPEEDAEPDLSEADPLRMIWTAVCAPFRSFLEALGITQSQCSRRFSIPLRTVQGWALGERSCPVYVRLMMAEIIRRGW